MATTTDDTTVAFSTSDGRTTDAIPLSEFEERAELAADRLRRQRQLTFDVGKAGGSPDFATLKLAGDFGLDRDLKRRAEVHVVVTDGYGEVVVEGDATVTSVQFRDKTDAHGNVTTERIHVATIGG